MRRRLHLPLHAQVIGVGAGAITLTGRARVRAEVSIDPGADIERRVEFLLRREQENQRALGLLGERLEDLEHESGENLIRLREGMEAHVTDALTETGAAYRAAIILQTIEPYWI